MTRPLWIDTDMGFDDLVAILMIARDRRFAIAGLSLVAGNAPLPVVIDNASRAARFFGWRFPIHAGRARPVLGMPITAAAVLGSDAMASAGRTLPAAGSAVTDADGVAALADFLRSGKGGGEVLALGPLTNIAALAMAAPEAAGRIGRLTWMGGSAGAGNYTASAEFNAFCDPEAVQVVIDAGVRIRMVGLDACRSVTVSADDAAALRGTGGERAAIIADLLDGYARIHHEDGSRPQAIYDPVAAAAVLDPAAVRFEAAHLAVELAGRLTRGMTVVERRPEKAADNADIARGADAASVRAMMLDALTEAASAPRTRPDA